MADKKEGVKVRDNKYGGICVITCATSNSYRIAIKARNRKGINSNDWYSEKEFNDRFKVI